MSKDIIAILTALITAFSTLMAVFITNYFNMKSLERNLRSQFQLKSYEIKLNKLEDFYELFEKWEANFSITYLNYLYFHNKKISESELHELMKNTTRFSNIFQKMMALLNIHFPELEEDYKKVNLARSEVVKYLKIERNINIEDFVQAQESFEEVAKKFKKQISLFAQKYKEII
ncbi:hypothetical protein [Acinetobacter ursingii]|uniref:hypothetical protein n=1 Tax=Acinetobacter ursingii TaxID=108980 RepID=UPI0021CDD8F0|nr:hypothetical protein [Acinetobacter ursingii]MCU4481134.1 hypothetical protein [Acinetobacter ursingii]MCU4505463.1 hypothetical protein [Acinetobacter ursingii]MCU4569532.1 hypothetical protein [Acinetobacter ursingii]